MRTRRYTYGSSRSDARRARTRPLQERLLFLAMFAAGYAHVPAPGESRTGRDLIRHDAPTISGKQEVPLHQKRYLEEALPGYTFIGVGSGDGAAAGEFSPLAQIRGCHLAIGRSPAGGSLSPLHCSSLRRETSR